MARQSAFDSKASFVSRCSKGHSLRLLDFETIRQNTEGHTDSDGDVMNVISSFRRRMTRIIALFAVTIYAKRVISGYESCDTPFIES